MKRLLLAVPAAASAILLACSPGDRMAGTKGGSETTNGVIACIRRSDGSPAAGAAVRLRRADYLSRPGLTMGKIAGVASKFDSSDIVTDPQGVFWIAGIDPGSYCIEVNEPPSAERHGGALLLACRVGANDTADLGIDSLAPFAAMKGAADTARSGAARLYAQIRGLERLAPVNTDGSFAFYDLPGGNLDVRVSSGGASSPAREIVNVSTKPGDTVAVRVWGNSSYSGYVYIGPAEADIQLSGVISNFPLLVRLDSSTFDFSRALPRGEDVRFAKADGSPLPCEIEQWDPAGHSAAVWVLIDTVSAAPAGRRIIMTWGDTGAISQSNGEAVFDTAAGFSGVWHLSENPASGKGAVKDRTPNRFNGTHGGTMTVASSVAGKIGPALRFNGVSDFIDAGPLNIPGSYTLSFWVNADDLSAARRFLWKEFSYTLWHDSIAGGLRVEHFTDSLVWRGIYQDNFRLVPMKTGAWYYLAGTFDLDKIRLYVNGAPRDSTQTIGATPHSSREPLQIGGRSGEFFKGVMDEVRIENRARSADWIRLCHLNQGGGLVVTKLKRQEGSYAVK
jgi:hypothetical protein